MSNYRMETEEETLFRSSPYNVYFVQSPSTASHANSTHDNHNNNNVNIINETSTLQSDVELIHPTNTNQEITTRLVALSRYSNSSHGSNHSSSLWHHHAKKISYDTIVTGSKSTVKDYEFEDEDEIEDDEYLGRKRGWQEYFSFSYSDSFAWFSLQLIWRIMVSLIAALVVFYVATKPPAPKVSIKIAGVKTFALTEGIDATGVTTKFLTCNIAMNLIINNPSKLFGLRLHPPLTAMYFGKLPFTVSRGSKLYANPDGTTTFKLYIGTRNKPMYGAGRNMQDQLESGKGLPLKIRVELRSKFHVVKGLINPKYHHTADCLLFLSSAYDRTHTTQAYNSTCIISS